MVSQEQLKNVADSKFTRETRLIWEKVLNQVDKEKKEKRFWQI